MARNRKNQSAAIRFGPALKAILLCLLIGGSAIGYVWQEDQNYDVGQQIRKRELRLQDLENQNDALRKQLAFMRSPAFLKARVKELNLGLVAPEASQVWYLTEPTPQANRQSARLAPQTPAIALNE